MRNERLTVIFPTLAEASRRNHIQRAITSIIASSQFPLRIVTVVNGHRCDSEVCSWLQAQPQVDFHYLETPSTALALEHGRKQVKTNFFSFLDDDDEYLPEMLDLRIQMLENNPDVDLIVTNGFRSLEGVDSIAMENLNNVEQDPFLSLFQENWLASCGGTFRTATVGPEFFHKLPRHLHWSWLGFQLCNAGRKVKVLNVPTFRIHDTPGSASKSETYRLTLITILEDMLARHPRKDVATVVRQRLLESHHSLSDYFLHRGRVSLAWQHHLKSLRHPAGWKFLPYTRRLVIPILS